MMFKALLKKQLLEVNQFYFKDRKTGKNRSVKGTVGYVLLFGLVFSIAAAMFLGMGVYLGSSFIPAGLGWLYFGMTGGLAVVMGVFGTVFNTYAGLFNAHDNELLLSMPVPSWAILASRLGGVFSMSLLYTGLAWLPCLIAYVYVCSRASLPVEVSVVACCLVLFVVLSMLVTALSCVAGWLVALVAGRVRNKSLVTVVLSLAFFAAYYYVYFRLNDALAALVELGERNAEAFKTWGAPLYLLGCASCGDVLALAGFFGATMAFFALVCAVMMRSFRSITTTRTASSKKVAFNRADLKASSPRRALLRRELKRFTSNATYLLNCGLGLVFMLAVVVLGVVNASDVMAFVQEIRAQTPELAAVLTVVPLAAVLMTGSMNTVSAPSVSLEGRSLWIARSLPVSTWSLLEAKLDLHVALCSVPTVLCALVGAVLMGLDPAQTVLTCAAAWLSVWAYAALGLVLNLLKPNLTWTNVTVAVKQNAAVMICIFGGLAASVVVVALFLFLQGSVSATVYLAIIAALLAVAFGLMYRWLRTSGAARYEAL